MPEKTKKKLRDAKTWERDGRLVDVATTLRETLGDALFEDHNRFRNSVASALGTLKIRLPAADLKQILKAVSLARRDRATRHRQDTQAQQS